MLHPGARRPDHGIRHPRRWVSVHRTDCTNAASLRQQSERIIEVHWAPSPSSVFLVAIQVEALDRHRLLSDITRALSDEKVNILSASVTTSNDRVAISRFTFEMGDPKHLGICSTSSATSRASTTSTGSRQRRNVGEQTQNPCSSSVLGVFASARGNRDRRGHFTMR
ncbi:ACT domain protein [Mycobacterium xenopi 4042]|uniref:ACT domain protein n=1 Tax=Mycobacterium xenopi 4042 TaxID=1299334 RepID=X8APC8_MYCXE|nr:ACT domain protein [Mycobacterium xenopi 4042]